MIKWVVVGVAGALAVGFTALGVMTLSGKIPDTKFVRWHGLSDDNQAFLRDEILFEGESVVWIYSAGLLELQEDGNLLTNQRVISYDDFDGDGSFSYAWLSDITAIRAKYGSLLLDGDLYVWQAEWTDEETGALHGGLHDPPLCLWMSAEEELDHAFVTDLVEGARDAGAELRSVELGGAIKASERRGIDGASSFDGDVWDAPPVALMLPGEGGGTDAGAR